MFILFSFVGILKSAVLTKTKEIIVKYNKDVKRLCIILEDLGYIYGFTVLDEHYLKVHLKFFLNKSVIRSINFFSKPSSRIFLKKKHLKSKNQISSKIFSNSFIILTTSKSKNFLTDVECILLNIGGEPLFVVS